jgi:DNA-directed RNA polymerase specialized sigma24 family protein
MIEINWRELGEALRSDDKAKAGAALDQLRPVLTAYARRHCGQSMEDDVVERVFVNLLENPQRIDPQQFCMTFLMRCLLTQTRNELANARRFPSASDVDLENVATNGYSRSLTPLDELIETEEQMATVGKEKKAMELIERLPGLIKELIALWSAHGHNWTLHLPSELGLSPKAARKKLSLALKRVRAELLESENDHQ